MVALRHTASTQYEIDGDSEIDHCCQNFSLLDDWLDAAGAQRRGTVGHADARLANSRDIVRVARERLAACETVFLHQRGACQECDDAWGRAF